MNRFFIVLLAFLIVLSACASDIDNTSSVSGEEGSVSSEVSSEEPVSSEESIVPVSSEETVSKEPKPFTPIKSTVDYFRAKTYSPGNSSAVVRYLFHEPIREYDEKRPLVIFLHGLGDGVMPNSLGTADQFVRALITLENESEEYGTYTLVPMTPLANEGWWTHGQLSSFKLLIKQLIEEYDIDPCRVYISGISMGGMVTCQLVNEMPPQTFAAAVPMSGAYILRSPERYHDTAFRIYHSAVDDVVDVSQSRNLEKLFEMSGHPNYEYIEFPEGNHVSPLYKVFRDNYREFFDWLFKQKIS